MGEIIANGNTVYSIDQNTLQWNRDQLRKIDPRQVDEERYTENTHSIVKIAMDIFFNFKLFWNSKRVALLRNNIEYIKSELSNEKTKPIYVSSMQVKKAAFSIKGGLDRRFQQRMQKLKELEAEDPIFDWSLLFGDEEIEEAETESTTNSTESIEQTLEEAKQIYSEFFKGVANFGEHFQALFEEKLTLPEGANVAQEGNILTITLPAAKSIRLDPTKELSQEQFDALNRNTDTEGLQQLNDDVNKSWKEKTIPASLNRGLCIKNLRYFGSFGSTVVQGIRFVTTGLRDGGSYGIETELQLERSGSTLTFVKGGPSGLKSIEFLPGYVERGGLIRVTTSGGSDVYFGKDFSTLFELGIVT